MSNLTTKELSAIEDQLTQEKTLITKYKAYASQTTDPQIKTQCEQISAKHQTHYTRLLNQLN